MGASALLRKAIPRSRTARLPAEIDSAARSRARKPPKNVRDLREVSRSSFVRPGANLAARWRICGGRDPACLNATVPDGTRTALSWPPSTPPLAHRPPSRAPSESWSTLAMVTSSRARSDLGSEAKFRDTTGIYGVRNAFGVVSDVNENYVQLGPGGRPRRRYRSVYTLFSTSGFSVQSASGAPPGEQSAGFPERRGPRRVALAAGGRIRVVPPEALPPERRVSCGDRPTLHWMCWTPVGQTPRCCRLRFGRRDRPALYSQRAVTCDASSTSRHDDRIGAA